MSWKKQDIVKPIPKEISSIVNEASLLVSTISPILSSLSALVSAASALYVSTLDPYKTLVTSALTEAQNLNNNFFNTGVYYLTVTGDKIGGKVKYDQYGIPLLTPAQAIDAVVASFDDTADFYRPQFNVSAQVSMVGFLATAPNKDQFIAMLNSFISVINLPDWVLLKDRIERRSSTATVYSEMPDWQSWRLDSIENMHEVKVLTNQLIAYLNGYATVPDTNLTDLSNIISGKISKLQSLSNSLSAFAASIGSVTGIYLVNLPITIGGNPALKSALMDCPLERSTNQYTILSVIVGGGPSLQTVDNFRKLVL